MIKNEPIYLSMRKYLLEVIEKNANVPDFKLPSENQLALRFSASRISAINAFKSLEREGLIYRRKGKGTFIADKAIYRNEDEKKIDLVCLIVPMVECQFIGEIVDGLRHELNTMNMRLVIFTTEDNEKSENAMIKYALSIGCKGLVIYPVNYSKYSDEMLKLALTRFPTVQIDRFLPGLGISYVSCDHFNATYRAVKYLNKKGHKRIGFISQSTDIASSVDTRIAGFDQAMLEQDTSYPNSYKYIINYDDPLFNEKLNEYLNRMQPTAILSNCNFYGPKIMRVLFKRNYHLETEIFDLMLFDNEFKEALEFLTFKPIIIDQNPFLIGKTTADLIYRLVYRSAVPEKILIQERIIQM